MYKQQHQIQDNEKLMEMNEYEIISYFEDRTMHQKIERIEEKNRIVSEARKMRNQGMSYRKISSLLHID